MADDDKSSERDDDDQGDDDDDDDDVKAPPARGDDDKKGDVPPEVKRALNKANKEAEKLRLQLKDYEDRDKSELQKLTERSEAAERKAEEATRDAMRARVGADKGLPRKFWDRLKGDDEKEMAADADDLLSEISPQDSTKRRPSFDGGAKDGKAPANGDMNALLLKGARGRS